MQARMDWPVPTLTVPIRAAAGAFRRDERGAIAMIAAIVLPVMALLIGMVFDYDRVSKARFAYQTAIDETARLMQDRRRRGDDAGSAARAHFKARLASAPGRDDVAFDADRSSDGLRLTARGRVATPFMALARVPHVDVVVRADVGL